jgi:futalosine hydrolase
MTAGDGERERTPRAERTARVRALRGAQAVVLLATEVEAAPLVAMLARPRPLQVTGGRWVRGRLAGTPVIVAVGGYDKANTAHALTLVLETGRPPLVIQCGIAGAYPGSGLFLRDIVLADEEVYADTGSSLPGGEWMPADGFGLPLIDLAGEHVFNRLPLDSRLVERARGLLAESAWTEPRPAIRVGRCLTLSCVTGDASGARSLARRWEAIAESMEGAAAAHVCALHGCSFLEVRAVSNQVGDRHREHWDVAGAASRAADAAAALVAGLSGLSATSRPLGDCEGA